MKQRAFTIIDLLVCLAVIALMMALLLPSLAGARSEARRVRCLAQLHQLAGVWHAETAINDCPPIADVHVLAESQGAADDEFNLAFMWDMPVHAASVWICPEDPMRFEEPLESTYVYVLGDFIERSRERARDLMLKADRESQARCTTLFAEKEMRHGGRGGRRGNHVGHDGAAR